MLSVLYGLYLRGRSFCMDGLLGACLLPVLCSAGVGLKYLLLTPKSAQLIFYVNITWKFIFTELPETRENNGTEILSDNWFGFGDKIFLWVPFKMNFIGWIFFLLFLGFLLYFFGGMLIMKMRGAEGIQIIPHYTFWITLPFKLKVNFTNLLSKITKIYS